MKKNYFLIGIIVLQQDEDITFLIFFFDRLSYTN